MPSKRLKLHVLCVCPNIKPYIPLISIFRGGKKVSGTYLEWQAANHESLV